MGFNEIIDKVRALHEAEAKAYEASVALSSMPKSDIMKPYVGRKLRVGYRWCGKIFVVEGILEYADSDMFGLKSLSWIGDVDELITGNKKISIEYEDLESIETVNEILI